MQQTLQDWVEALRMIQDELSGKNVSQTAVKHVLADLKELVSQIETERLRQ
jgi:hypothetical protein